MKIKMIRRFVILLLIVILSGCSNHEKEFDSLSQRIELLEMENESLSNVADALDSLEIEIDELQNEMDVLKEDSVTDNDNLDNQITNIKRSISNLDDSIEYIENMIWRNCLFDRNEVTVGDYVSGMELTEIDGHDNQILQFTGETYVTGSFGIVTDDYVVGDGVTFSVDRLSSYLPREINDRRDLWFVFTNYEEALLMLEDYKDCGEISIIIDEYKLDLTESAVVNTAKLVKVISEK